MLRTVLFISVLSATSVLLGVTVSASPAYVVPEAIDQQFENCRTWTVDKLHYYVDRSIFLECSSGGTTTPALNKATLQVAALSINKEFISLRVRFTPSQKVLQVGGGRVIKTRWRFFERWNGWEEARLSYNFSSNTTTMWYYGRRAVEDFLTLLSQSNKLVFEFDSQVTGEILLNGARDAVKSFQKIWEPVLSSEPSTPSIHYGPYGNCDVFQLFYSRGSPQQILSCSNPEIYGSGVSLAGGKSNSLAFYHLSFDAFGQTLRPFDPDNGPRMLYNWEIDGWGFYDQEIPAKDVSYTDISFHKSLSVHEAEQFLTKLSNSEKLMFSVDGKDSGQFVPLNGASEAVKSFRQNLYTMTRGEYFKGIPSSHPDAYKSSENCEIVSWISHQGEPSTHMLTCQYHSSVEATSVPTGVIVVTHDHYEGAIMVRLKVKVKIDFDTTEWRDLDRTDPSWLVNINSNWRSEGGDLQHDEFKILRNLAGPMSSSFWKPYFGDKAVEFLQTLAESQKVVFSFGGDVLDELNLDGSKEAVKDFFQLWRASSFKDDVEN